MSTARLHICQSYRKNRTVFSLSVTRCTLVNSRCNTASCRCRRQRFTALQWGSMNRSG